MRTIHSPSKTHIHTNIRGYLFALFTHIFQKIYIYCHMTHTLFYCVLECCLREKQ